MSDYGEFQRKHRRLAILRHLAEIEEYTGNVAIIQDVLTGVGIPSTRAQIVTELSWLKEQGFLTYDATQECIVATATMRGVEIARGLATHPDIQRPSPRR